MPPDSTPTAGAEPAPAAPAAPAAEPAGAATPATPSTPPPSDKPDKPAASLKDFRAELRHKLDVAADDRAEKAAKEAAAKPDDKGGGTPPAAPAAAPSPPAAAAPPADDKKEKDKPSKPKTQPSEESLALREAIAAKRAASDAVKLAAQQAKDADARARELEERTKKLEPDAAFAREVREALESDDWGKVIKALGVTPEKFFAENGAYIQLTKLFTDQPEPTPEQKAEAARKAEREELARMAREEAAKTLAAEKKAAEDKAAEEARKADEEKTAKQKADADRVEAAKAAYMDGLAEKFEPEKYPYLAHYGVDAGEVAEWARATMIKTGAVVEIEDALAAFERSFSERLKEPPSPKKPDPPPAAPAAAAPEPARGPSAVTADWRTTPGRPAPAPEKAKTLRQERAADPKLAAMDAKWEADERAKRRER